jgi:hypothetical protein
MHYKCRVTEECDEVTGRTLKQRERERERERDNPEEENKKV